MEKINWSKIIDGITVFMLGIVLLILVVCTVVLLSFDSLVGTGSMMVFTNQHLAYSSFISLATTGMGIALAFMAYLAYGRGYDKLGLVFGIAAGFVLLIDVYFDSLTADWLRYGAFTSIKNLPAMDQNNHILFRILIGGLSLIGEPLAVAIIVGMPELKTFIRSVLPQQTRTQPGTTPTYQPRQYPASIPTAKPTYQGPVLPYQEAQRRAMPTSRPTPAGGAHPTQHTLNIPDDIMPDWMKE